MSNSTTPTSSHHPNHSIPLHQNQQNQQHRAPSATSTDQQLKHPQIPLSAVSQMVVDDSMSGDDPAAAETLSNVEAGPVSGEENVIRVRVLFPACPAIAAVALAASPTLSVENVTREVLRLVSLSSPTAVDSVLAALRLCRAEDGLPLDPRASLRAALADGAQQAGSGGGDVADGEDVILFAQIPQNAAADVPGGGEAESPPRARVDSHFLRRISRSVTQRRHAARRRSSGGEEEADGGSTGADKSPSPSPAAGPIVTERILRSGRLSAVIAGAAVRGYRAHLRAVDRYGGRRVNSTTVLHSFLSSVC